MSSETFKSIRGTESSDRLKGKGSNERIFGEDGNDYLFGREGDDRLFGGQGDDVLKGGKGDDTLYGNDGNDTLKGGKGDDTFYGGEGNDTFVFRAGDGQDTIADFSTGRWVEVKNPPWAWGREGDNWIFKVRIPVDKIQIEGVQGGFEGLTITQNGADTVIAYGDAGDTITLQNVEAWLVSASLFDFV